MDNRDYYCSVKFKYLKIDLESKTTYNCHASRPHPVDFAWLSKNTGQIFNIPINVHERQQMLINERNSSCEQNCWPAEDVGAISPRLYQSGDIKSHTQPVTFPETIDLTIGGDCNLTCSYCSKEFSSAWRRDIANNGDYPLTNTLERFQLNNKDRILLNISQPQLKSTKQYQQLLTEIKLVAPTLKNLIITGGEPFLDNQLFDILPDLNLSPETTIEIYTGLGVSMSRFTTILSKLESIPNLVLIVSAENTKNFLEFNRYGVKWDEVIAKIDLIKDKKINFKFHSTISNLTIFDFVNFYNTFKNEKITLTFAYQPGIMMPYVLDNDSKEQIKQDILSLPMEMQRAITHSIKETPTEDQKINSHIFLQEFTRRRPNLDINIFPKSFLKWLGL
jgi:organic radical activating enzyme